MVGKFQCGSIGCFLFCVTGPTWKSRGSGLTWRTWREGEAFMRFAIYTHIMLISHMDLFVWENIHYIKINWFHNRAMKHDQQ